MKNHEKPITQIQIETMQHKSFSSEPICAYLPLSDPEKFWIRHDPSWSYCKMTSQAAIQPYNYGILWKHIDTTSKQEHFLSENGWTRTSGTWLSDKPSAISRILHPAIATVILLTDALTVFGLLQVWKLFHSIAMFSDWWVGVDSSTWYNYPSISIYLSSKNSFKPF